MRDIRDIMHEKKDAALARLAENSALQPQELAAFDESQLTVLVTQASTDLNAARLAEILADPRVNAAFLNRRFYFFTDARVAASFLECVVLRLPQHAADMAAKVACLDLLLDAGASNVNECHYQMGVSRASPFMGMFIPPYWEGVDEAEHRRLIGRMLAAGGNPRYRPQPLAYTAVQYAEEYYPQFLELLPLNLMPDGQQYALLPLDNVNDWSRTPYKVAG